METDNRFDVLSLGNLAFELLAWVERYPSIGDGIHADHVLWTGGGMAGNLAHAVARLGGRVAMICAIGEDCAGDQIIEQLKKAGVNTDYVVRRAGLVSPVTVLMIDPDKKRAGLVTGKATQATLQSQEIPDALLQSSRAYFTDLLPASVSIEVAERAHRLNLPVAFDLQMAPLHVNEPNHMENIARIFTIADYFFADEENFLLWRGQANLQAAVQEALSENPTATLVITRGLDGSRIFTRGEAIDIPAFPVKMVDSIGAGDAYHGAFLLAHVAYGQPLLASGLFASATAALSCLGPGAREALPTREQVFTFLHERGIDIHNLHVVDPAAPL